MGRACSVRVPVVRPWHLSSPIPDGPPLGMNVLSDAEKVSSPIRGEWRRSQWEVFLRRRLGAREAVDRRRQTCMAGLDLQCQYAREESHQPKIAVVEPKAPLPRRLPYVPGLSSPWPSVASEAG